MKVSKWLFVILFIFCFIVQLAALGDIEKANSKAREDGRKDMKPREPIVLSGGYENNLYFKDKIQIAWVHAPKEATGYGADGIFGIGYDCTRKRYHIFIGSRLIDIDDNRNNVSVSDPPEGVFEIYIRTRFHYYNTNGIYGSGYDNSHSIKSYLILIDRTQPLPPSELALSSIINYYVNTNNIIFTNEENILLEWLSVSKDINGDDDLSGVKEYIIYFEDNSEFIEYDIRAPGASIVLHENNLPLTEGYHQYMVAAMDNSRNVSELSDIFGFWVDRSPPGTVMLSLEDITMEYGDEKWNYTLKWNSVEDSPEEGSCGMQSYKIQKRSLNGKWIDVAEIPAGENQQQYSHTISDELAGNTYYDLRVLSIDNLGNVNDNNDDVPLVSLKTPPPALKIEEIAATASQQGNSPLYTNYITLNTTINLLNHSSIEKYQIHRRLAGESSSEVIYEGTAADIVNDLNGNREQWQKDNNLRPVFIDKLFGAQFAHKKFIYSVVTVYKYGGAMIANDYFETQVANLNADFTILVESSTLGTSMELDVHGVDPETGLSGNITVNDSVSITLVPKSGTGKDLEGDSIKYQLWTINGTMLAETWADGNSIEMYVSRTLVYPLYLHVEEYIKPIAGDEELIAKHDTVTGEPKKGFYITFDNGSPIGAFKIVKRNGTADDEYTVANPAATNLVSVLIEVGAITDAVEYIGSDVSVDSGIEKVEIWNLDLSEFTDILHIVPEDIKRIAVPEPTPFIPFNGETGAVPHQTKSEDWRLAAGVDGYRVVVMKIYDTAGNTAIDWRVLAMDTDVPDVPDLSTIKHTHYEDNIFLDWNSPVSDNSEGYIIGYNTTGTVQEEKLTRGRTSFPIPITGLGPNTEIPVTLVAYDFAGNESEAASISFYTLPEPGDITEINQGYETQEHYVEWILSGGTAEKHELEILAPDGTIKEILQLTDGKFLYNNDLRAHSTINYRLVAYNSFEPPGGGSGDKIQLKPHSYTLTNNPPNSPENLSPVSVASASFVFSWDQALDVDGDLITYHIYYREESAANLTLLTSTQNTFYTSESDVFESGKIYYWYVMADDTPSDGSFIGKATASQTVSFSFDAEGPIIEFKDLPEVSFTKQQSIKFVVSDTQGAVAEVVYWTSDNVVHASSPKSVTLTQIDDTHYEGEITLHDADMPYSITVRAQDGAGNITEEKTPEFRIDRTAPHIESIDMHLELNNQQYMCSSQLLEAVIHVQDNFSGVTSYSYAFVENQADIDTAEWQMLKVEHQVRLEGQTEIKRYVRTHKLMAEDGKQYYFAVRATDWAGNVSEVYFADYPIFVDSSPPQAQLNVQGLIASSGSYFVIDINNVTPDFTYSDEHSEVSAFYSIQDVNVEQEPIWYATWQEAKAQSLILGSIYKIKAKAVNATGAETIVASHSFLYDNSAPTILAVYINPEEPLVPNQEVRVTIKAEDNESGIAEYWIGFGTPFDRTSLSKTIPGNTGGWLKTAAYADKGEFDFIIPEQAKGEYVITARAVNKAGLSAKSLSPYKLIVDETVEKIIVYDNGPYTSASLLASWLYRGSNEPTGYEYRIVTDSTTVQDWLFTTATEINNQSLSLTEGVCYYFEIRARFADNSLSAVGRSLGVTADLSAPVFDAAEGLITPIASTSTNVQVSWNVQDMVSGVQTVNLLVEQVNQGGEKSVLSDWVTIGGCQGSLILSSDAQGNPLNLTTGTRLYLTARAVNGAGLLSEKTSLPVIVDDTPPPAPQVTDQGDVINTAQDLDAHWQFSQDDPESGIISYQWAAFSEPVPFSELEWQDAGTDKQAVFSGNKEHLDIWYFAVKAVNAAGLESIGVSNGILCDSTAPYLAKVKVIDIYNPQADPASEEEIYYISSAEDLELYIDSYDDESPVSLYRGISGTRTAGGNWLANAGIAAMESTENLMPIPVTAFLADGITVFRGECINDVGLISEYGYTRGIRIDGTEPQISYVTGYIIENDIYFDWQAAQTGSPITEYFVAFVPEASTPELTDFISNGKNTSYHVNISEQGIAQGRYRLYVGAYNAAGILSSEPGISNTIIVDLSPPEISQFEYDAYAATKLPIHIEASDAQSGISEYIYTVGTAIDNDLYSGGFISIPSSASQLSHIIDLTSLYIQPMQGTEVFVMVKARNGAGRWSAAATSSKIIVDYTPPSAPLVTCPEQSKYSIRVQGIGAITADAESGISHLRVHVVTATDLTEIPDPVAIDTAGGTDPAGEYTLEDYTLEDVSLAEATVYYIAIQSRNRAGLWSAIGYSPQFMVDSTPPTLTFMNEDSVIIVNQTPAEIAYEVSEDVEATFSLEYPDGSTQSFAPVLVTEGSNIYSFTQTVSGLYTLRAVVVDGSGNVGNQGADASVQRIRVNAAPVVTLTEITTTPGRPVELSAGVYDPDGDAPFSYAWDFGDGSALEYTEAPVHSYFHTDIINQETIYTLSLTVTDSGGQTTTVQTEVKVYNTTKGRLYTDEHWSGMHIITGDILVPEGITLYTSPATSVQVSGNPIDGYNHRITIEGTLTPGTGTIFSIEQGKDELWNGLFIKGEAALNTITVENARFALTITETAQITATGSVFRQNETGIHILGTDSSIADCAFEANTVYGIKEDADAEPRVTDCRFKNNLYDYYDDKLTVISIDRLNDKPGCSGNIKE